MISKKALLLIALSATLIVVLVDLIGIDKLCGGTQYTNCMKNMHSGFLVLIPFIALFLVSIFVHWIRQDMYESWFRFARWWVPLSMIAIFLAPEYDKDFLFPIEKGTVSLFLSVVFLIVSTLIILVKYFSNKK